MTNQEIIEAMVEAYDDAYEAEYLLHGARGNNYDDMCAAFVVREQYPWGPTQAMLNAARDWSVTKYGAASSPIPAI